MYNHNEIDIYTDVHTHIFFPFFWDRLSYHRFETTDLSSVENKSYNEKIITTTKTITITKQSKRQLVIFNPRTHICNNMLSRRL